MQLVEMTVEEAMRVCGKQSKVLVAIHNLEKKDCNTGFVIWRKEEYEKLFEDVQTVASCMDDIVKQLNCYTYKQNIMGIKPKGVQKTVLLK